MIYDAVLRRADGSTYTSKVVSDRGPAVARQIAEQISSTDHTILVSVTESQGDSLMANDKQDKDTKERVAEQSKTTEERVDQQKVQTKTTTPDKTGDVVGPGGR